MSPRYSGFTSKPRNKLASEKSQAGVLVFVLNLCWLSTDYTACFPIVATVGISIHTFFDVVEIVKVTLSLFLIAYPPDHEDLQENGDTALHRYRTWHINPW
jgi:hypothetical protein